MFKDSLKFLTSVAFYLDKGPKSGTLEWNLYTCPSKWYSGHEYTSFSPCSQTFRKTRDVPWFYSTSYRALFSSYISGLVAWGNYLALRYISQIGPYIDRHSERNSTSGNTQEILNALASRNWAHLWKVCLYFQACHPRILANDGDKHMRAWYRFSMTANFWFSTVATAQVSLSRLLLLSALLF